jgi:HPt (histidine-containing phosphotransfer) domain-containing protein
VAGLDRRSIEAYFGGDVSLYRQTLHAFVEHLQATLPRLPDALQARDRTLLAREGHTLKGLAHTVGHGTLAERARHLERVSATGEQAELERAVALLVDAAMPLADALQRALAREQAAPASALVPAAPDAPLVQRLVRLATDSDGQALLLWQRHRSAFAAWLHPSTFARLDDALARCDFDAAARQLQESELGSNPADRSAAQPESHVP